MNLETSEGTYTVLWGGVSDESTFMNLMHNTTQFLIQVYQNDVEGTEFERDYTVRVNKDNEGIGNRLDNWTSLCRCILTPCFPLLEELAPARTSEKHLTIQSFVQTSTYSLRVVAVDGYVRANVESGPNYLPAYDLSPMPMAEMPAFGDVPKFRARDLTLLVEEDEYYSRGMPRRVCLAVTDDGPAIVGMLLEWIHRATLASDVCIQARNHHAKWENQVVGIVEFLHAHDIVWGDVNTCNVIIDKDFNAWVIDFGGRCNPQFVDEENAETKKGDWQGIQRLFDEWLVQRTTEVEQLP